VWLAESDELAVGCFTGVVDGTEESEDADTAMGDSADFFWQESRMQELTRTRPTAVYLYDFMSLLFCISRLNRGGSGVLPSR
jgi:hypothetical protein